MKVSYQQKSGAFVTLGTVMTSLGRNEAWPGYSSGLSESEYQDLQHIVEINHHYNGWFTAEFIRKAMLEWGVLLQADSLKKWLSAYPIPEYSENPKNVGVICAGNIPMVGFHDILSVIMSGHIALIKLSSDDNKLIPALLHALVTIEPQMAETFSFVEQRLSGHQAAIATGSTNTSRYFRYYFGHMPHIIRKGRTSVAILDGTETAEELLALGHDIFDYFGLGCRNISKIYLPKGYELDIFFKAIYDFHPIVNHNKYANNYDYNKAVWLLNQENLLDNGFILLKEESSLASPTASLYFEYYEDEKVLRDQLATQSESIQCIVGKKDIPFGTSQSPSLSEYADGVDTMAFLTQL
jgi:hypothetical protein